MKDIIIFPEWIKVISNNFDERNALMSELAKTDASDPFHFFKWIFAFWLGNTPVLEKIKSSNENRYKALKYTIFQVYYCLLILDKNISQFHHDEIVQDRLKKAWVDILLTYNARYTLFNDSHINQLTFIDLIEQNIKAIPIDHPIYLAELTQIKAKCLNATSLCYDDNFLNRDVIACEPFTQFMKGFTKDIITANSASASTRILKILSMVGTRHQFYSTLKQPELLINKILLPADDHILLDGLHIKRKQEKLDSVLIASIANKQSEYTAITDKIIKLANIFNAEIIYPNHRNHSQRAAIFSDSLERIAMDIVCFVKHAAKLNKQIILYGLCGGTPQMILAAKILQQEGIKFKIIIDRFAQQYLNFVHPKSLFRCIVFQSDYNQSIAGLLIKNTLPISSLYLLYFSFYLVATYTNLHIDFTEIVKNLPEEDVLILQGRSEKSKSSFSEPLSTDIDVHPDFEMRAAIKKQRHSRKNLLITLALTCQNIANNSSSLPDIKDIFSQLNKRYLSIIDLINDEKLINKNPTIQPANIHSLFIGDLATRSRTPIGQFLNGFFLQKKDWPHLLERIQAFTFNDIFETLSLVCSHPISMKTKLNLTEQLQEFFNLSHTNRDYLYRMSNRLQATNLPDLFGPLEKLIQSDFFQCLEEKAALHQKHVI